VVLEEMTAKGDLFTSLPGHTREKAIFKVFVGFGGDKTASPQLMLVTLPRKSCRFSTWKTPLLGTGA